MVPITGRASSVLENVLCTYVRFQKQNRKEKEEDTEQQQTYHFTADKNILHILHVHHLTLNFIIQYKYNFIISTLYLYTYIHTYILEKWFPLQGERAHSLKKFVFETPISIQIKSKSNPNQIHSLILLFFLPLTSRPT